MTYARLHILTVYSCDSCPISLFMLLSVMLQFSYLSCYLVSYIFVHAVISYTSVQMLSCHDIYLSYICSRLSCYSVICCLQLFLILLYAHVLMHELFSLYTHTHHGRVLTTLDLHVQILDDWFSLCRCTLRLCSLRIAGASPYSILVLLSF